MSIEAVTAEAEFAAQARLAAGALSITAIVLTKDEELHLERCLTRLAPLAARIIVVDSFSSDDTVAIARRLGAEVVLRRFVNQAEQFQWALDNCDIRTDWVLRVDADEYFEPEALEQIMSDLPGLGADITGVEFKRKFIFREQWIRHGRYYPTVLVRLWRTGAGAIEQRWMDEHVVLAHGGVVRFGRGDLVDHNLHDIGWWTDKHNRYATRHMVDFINLEFGLYEEDTRLIEAGAGERRRKRMKYARAPLYLRALMYFIYRYVVRLGFLDGRKGFVFHFLHGFWFFMLIDAKIDEARGFIRAHGLDAFKAHLAKAHGIEL
jgi:glycosyltransferase involved in cell wall biosynthesis